MDVGHSHTRNGASEDLAPWNLRGSVRVYIQEKNALDDMSLQKDMGMGQNQTNGIWTAGFSAAFPFAGGICQGKPFWGYPIFDNHSHVLKWGNRAFPVLVPSRWLPEFMGAWRGGRGGGGSPKNPY